MKKLYRAREDKMWGGVCAGLGEYLEVDPTLIRLAFVLLALVTGIVPVLIFYLIAWIIVPAKPTAGHLS